MKEITIKEVEDLAFSLARKHLAFTEPIPAFSTRFPNILESSTAAPFQTFGQKPLYRGLTAKAAILFYLMIKNHPFANGNKRIAMTTLFLLLYKNHKWLKIDIQELYNFTMWITQSNPSLKKETVQAIEKLLQIHLIDLA
ncbi:MAG: type II toxin-antitoxin system death-on-curing family toxin [bacterium]